MISPRPQPVTPDLNIPMAPLAEWAGEGRRCGDTLELAATLPHTPDMAWWRQWRSDSHSGGSTKPTLMTLIPVKGQHWWRLTLNFLNIRHLQPTELFSGQKNLSLWRIKEAAPFYILYHETNCCYKKMLKLQAIHFKILPPLASKKGEPCFNFATAVFKQNFSLM